VELLIQKGAALPATRKERKKVERALREGAERWGRLQAMDLPATEGAEPVDYEEMRRILTRYGVK
jgi:hypothetical protein